MRTAEEKGKKRKGGREGREKTGRAEEEGKGSEEDGGKWEKRVKWMGNGRDRMERGEMGM